MSNKIRQGWQALTQAKANVWLTSVIVILFIITVAILNTLNLKYGESQARYLSGAGTLTGSTMPPIYPSGDICTEQDPSVSVSPTSQSTYPGGPIQYTITVTNTGCVAHSYTIDAKKPSANWTKTFSTFKTGNLASTQSQTVTLTMSSPGTIGNGTYPIVITASTVSNGTTYETEATALYTVANPVVESFTINRESADSNGIVYVPTNSPLAISWRCGNTITSDLRNNHGYILATGGNSMNFKKEKIISEQVTYTVTCYGGPNYTGNKTTKAITVKPINAIDEQ